MSKNFLSKKSWHTGSIKNIEDIWVREQGAHEEKKKNYRLQREKEEEQRRFELRRMAEVAAGRKIVDRVEWMYQIKAGPSAEEYLTGKKLIDEEENDIEKFKKAPGSLFLQTTNPLQDQEAKVRDDPLLAIKAQEQKALKKILDNPVQMKKIKESDDMKKLLKKKKKLNKRKNEGEDSRKESKHEAPSRSKEEKGRNEWKRPHKKAMTQEERERRIKEMEMNGKLHEENRLKKIEKYVELAKMETQESGNKNEKPSFINEMNRKVYTESKEGLEDRVRRNIHFVDKRIDDRNLFGQLSVNV